MEQAYLDLLSAKNELRKIQQKHRICLIANASKEAALEHWIETEGGRKVTDNLETPIAIVLSLLDCYPESKQGLTIAFEIGSSHPTVSRYLTGDLGNYGQYFEKCNGEYRLTEEGILFISEWLGTNNHED